MADESTTPVEEATPKKAVPERMPHPGEGVVYMTNDLREGVELPAVVMALVGEEGDVSLRVDDPAGAFTASPIDYDAGGAPGTWHWPEVKKAEQAHV